MHGQIRDRPLAASPFSATRTDVLAASARHHPTPTQTNAVCDRPPAHSSSPPPAPDEKEFSILNHQIEASDVHMHNPTRAHIQMPNLAVAHLPLGQSDKWPAGMNQRIRKLPQHPVIGRLASQRNSVSLTFSAVSPAIEDDKNEWFRTRHKNAFSS